MTGAFDVLQRDWVQPLLERSVSSFAQFPGGKLIETEGKRLVERMDECGLHMTAQLRQRADELIEDAARD